jgi:hypothetical protein
MLRGFIVAAAAAAVSASSAPTWTVASAVVSAAGKWSCVPGSVSGAVAVANYSDAIDDVGWAFLDLTTSASFPNEQQAYAAGFVEACLTQLRIYQTWLNNGYASLPAVVEDFFHKNAAWMAEKVSSNPDDEYWQHGSWWRARCRGAGMARERCDARCVCSRSRDDAGAGAVRRLRQRRSGVAAAQLHAGVLCRLIN